MLQEISDKESNINILAFLGRTGKLATAQLHGNVVNIWDISSHKALITDPCTTYQPSKSAKISRYKHMQLHVHPVVNYMSPFFDHLPPAYL